MRAEGFYWARLKPYEQFGETHEPDWEPLRWEGGSWARAGSIYRFPEDEVAEVGQPCAPPSPAEAELVKLAKSLVIDIQAMEARGSESGRYGPFTSYEMDFSSAGEGVVVEWGNLDYLVKRYHEIVGNAGDTA